MKTITLRRISRKNNAVLGLLTLPFSKPHEYETIENADYIIPAGIYPLRLTWSPRFKKEMPEICDVPDREGIRIHMGTKPEHSTGCVLTSFAGLENTKVFINAFNKYKEEDDDEQLYIEIREQRDGLDESPV